VLEDQTPLLEKMQNQERLENLVLLDQKEKLAYPDPLEHQEPQAQLVLMAQVENPDQLEKEECQERQVSQENLERPELLEHWENEVYKVKLVHQEVKERKDGEEQEDHKDFKDVMDFLEKLVWMAKEEYQDQTETLEIQV